MRSKCCGDTLACHAGVAGSIPVDRSELVHGDVDRYGDGLDGKSGV